MKLQARWMGLAICFLVEAFALNALAPQAFSQIAEPHSRQSFHMEVLTSPAPVPIAGTTYLVYELHLTSFAHDTLMLASVQVLDDASETVIAELRGAVLEAALGRLGIAPEATNRRAVAPGRRAIVYFKFPLGEAPSPRVLRHRVEFNVMTEDGRERAAVEGGVIEIDERPLPELGPPLRGGPWVVVHHPSWKRGHRRVVYALAGRARIPGRFAVDYMKANEPQSASPGDGSRTADTYGLGADVLAVADAVVVAARNDMATPKDCAERVPLALEDEAGNYVVLDLGGGRYVFYEHLQPGGSVAPGDRVRRGQVIGALGCTGSATRPHLHVHVGNALPPLAAEGLPYVLMDFSVVGVYDSIERFFQGERWRERSPEKVTPLAPSFPAPNVVVRFPE